MTYAVPRRHLILDFVTQQTGPTYAERLARALDGRLEGNLTPEETIEVLLRSVRALYLVTGWLADELDKVEAAVGAR